MQGPTSSVPTITDILKRIADDKALTLFNNIALTNEENFIPLKGMQLSVKQYYSRISELMKAGLIKRSNGNYHLALLGKIVYDAYLGIGKALNYYWKLKAIESIQASAGDSLPREEVVKLIHTLIDNHQIKDILLPEWFNETSDRSCHPNTTNRTKKLFSVWESKLRAEYSLTAL
jgi:hypothetical protein